MNPMLLAAISGLAMQPPTSLLAAPTAPKRRRLNTHRTRCPLTAASAQRRAKKRRLKRKHQRAARRIQRLRSK